MTATDSMSWLNKVKAQESAKNGIDAALQSKVNRWTARAREMNGLVHDAMQVRVYSFDYAVYQLEVAESWLETSAHAVADLVQAQMLGRLEE